MNSSVTGSSGQIAQTGMPSTVTGQAQLGASAISSASILNNDSGVSLAGLTAASDVDLSNLVLNIKTESLANGNIIGPQLPTLSLPAANVATSGLGMTTTAPTVGTSTTPPKIPDGAKRLHVSNIPFRFREPDLRAMFQVNNATARVHTRSKLKTATPTDPNILAALRGAGYHHQSSRLARSPAAYAAAFAALSAQASLRNTGALTAQASALPGYLP
ncbi:Fox-1-like protein [Trichinella spiralis]|uniref:Fox-1-like protein n=1 Tax=Trichinella spiralis TaxID=6334 RepID=UPI0001EFD1DB|nr:Fox-1-like protein [Trichinella spiralis]